MAGDSYTQAIPISYGGTMSGDQSGVSSAAAGLLVRLAWFDPSTFITYMSESPSLRETKETLLPSGDQVGDQSWAGLLVRLVWLEPSTSIMYISEALPSL